MLVKELRQELAKRGLNTSGKKADLEKRYNEALAKEAEDKAEIDEDAQDEQEKDAPTAEPVTSTNEAPQEADSKEEEKPVETAADDAEKEADGEEETGTNATEDGDGTEAKGDTQGSTEEKAEAKEDAPASTTEEAKENGKQETEPEKMDVDAERPQKSRSKERDFRPLSTGRSADDRRDEGNRLYVGNLDFGVREEDIREEFGKYGDLVDVYLPMDRYSRRPRGFAFLNFKSREGANAAIDAMHHKQFLGRTLQVNIARPRPTDSHRSRGRDSYRRRRSRSPRYRDRRRSYGRSRSPRRDRY